MADDPKDPLPLYEPEGYQLRVSPEGRGGYESQATGRTPGASLSGPSPRYSVAKTVGMSGTSSPAMKVHQQVKKLSPEELQKLADAMESELKQQHEASLRAGPSVKLAQRGTPESGYESEVGTGSRMAYDDWKNRVAPGDPGMDYDYHGAFAAGLERDSGGHFPDTFKKPNHPTFSDESQYTDSSAGHWTPGGFSPAPGAPPPWLKSYMNEQPQTDPYHEAPKSRADIIMGNPYMSDADKQAALRGQLK